MSPPAFSSQEAQDMSSAKPAGPTSADLPLDPIPVQDAGHPATPAIDPDMIARLERELEGLES